MGQVFTWDAVQHGHFPNPESFTEVLAMVRDDLASVPAILGAIACGSVIRKDHNVRSDIDCFVLYDHTKTRGAFKFMQRMTVMAAGVHVPLAFIPLDMQLARTPMHHVGPSFLEHLQKSVKAGGILKGNPLALVGPSIYTRDELEAYMRVKMYNLQEAFAQSPTFSEERTASYLKKLLEAPMHIARKVLAHSAPLEEDSKQYVKERYRQVMPANLAGQLDFLVRLDEAYTAEFYAQRAAPNETQYRDHLANLMESSYTVLQFIRENLVHIANTAR